MYPGEEKITKRRKWNDEEDDTLRTLVEAHGSDNWRLISQVMNGRDSKQCRERYMNHLDPNVKKGKLSKEEWIVLFKAHENLGNKYKFPPDLRPPTLTPACPNSPCVNFI
jgi:hypothetical protein